MLPALSSAASAAPNYYAALSQTLGNHEFDFGPAGLATYLKQTNFPMVGGCNVNVSNEPALKGLVQKYVVKIVKGIKVKKMQQERGSEGPPSASQPSPRAGAKQQSTQA